MTGARFVQDTLEPCGWEVEVADAQKKGLAPLACKRRVHAQLDAVRCSTRCSRQRARSRSPCCWKIGSHIAGTTSRSESSAGTTHRFDRSSELQHGQQLAPGGAEQVADRAA